MLLALGGAIVLGAGLLLGGIYGMQRRLIYFPDNNLPHPAAVGLPGVQVGRIQTSDGLSLIAWYTAPEGAGIFVVLYLHGNAGNIAHGASRILRFAELGWGVLLPEYRGYGGNPGTPSEQGLLEDARAAFARLREIGTPSGRILLWGESLGTGLAVRLATENAVACLLLKSPYTSIVDVARWHLPWLPVGLLMRDRFDSLARIGEVRGPFWSCRASATRSCRLRWGSGCWPQRGQPRSCGRRPKRATTTWPISGYSTLPGISCGAGVRRVKDRPRRGG